MYKYLLLPLLLAFTQPAAQVPAPFLLQNASVVDVEQGWTNEMDILVRDGKIVEMGRDFPVPDDVLPLDVSGKYLIPGLVDAHIHLFQSGGLYTRPDALDLQAFRPYEEEREWLKEQAPAFLKRYLQAGITSVIDMGGPMYNYAIRDSFSESNTFPNLYLTGPLISTYQPDAFRIEDAPIIEVADAKAAVALVRKQLPYKPDFIKVWYIAEEPDDADQSYEIVEATIQESHENGLKVAVHATQLYTAKLAIKAGADILVHSIDDPIDQDFIDLVVAKEIPYIPTLVVHRNYIKAFGQSRNFSPSDFAISHPIPLGHLLDCHHLRDNKTLAAYKHFADKQFDPLAKMDSIRLDNLKRLSDAGAIIATGTDAGNIGTLHASSYYDELAYMRRSGMSTQAILVASTVSGAKVLGNGSGRLAKGESADMLLLNSNPLLDVMAVQDIYRVVKGGQMRAPADFVRHSPEELAQMQLNAYNCGDIEAFLAPYSQDVELYDFPDELTSKGKDKMTPRYADMFKRLPDLHCELVQRDVLGNTVIDHERITGIPGVEPFEAIAIYKIEGEKIAKVYFIR